MSDIGERSALTEAESLLIAGTKCGGKDGTGQKNKTNDGSKGLVSTCRRQNKSSLSPMEISDDGLEYVRQLAQNILNAATANIENRDRPLPSEQESLMSERTGIDPVRVTEIVVEALCTRVGRLDVQLLAEGDIRLWSLLQQRAEGLESNLGVIFISDGSDVIPCIFQIFEPCGQPLEGNVPF